MRGGLLALLLLVVAVPPAGAEAPGLLDAVDGDELALAGTDVLVARSSSSRVRLDAVARNGGLPRTLASIPSAQVPWPGSLAASAQRVVLAVEHPARAGKPAGWEIHSGPPSGPLKVISRTRGARAWVPLQVAVDGDRALLVEGQSSGSGIRAALLGTDGERRPVRWATRRFIPIAIAGGYAAAIGARPRRIAVVRLRDGRVLASRRVRKSDRLAIDVAADGRVLAAVGGELLLLRVGGSARRVRDTAGWRLPRFAGRAIAGVQQATKTRVQRPSVLEAPGMSTVIGGPTGLVDDLAADRNGVAWLANGCVRYASASGATAAARFLDPCPSTEIALAYIASSRLRDGTVRVPVQCIATPTDACRGTLVLSSFRTKEAVVRAPFAIPAGVVGSAPIALDARAIAVGRSEGGWVVDADIPNGRARPGPGASELTLKE